METFPPLSSLHPLVVEATPCWLCERPFISGQRTMAVPIETAEQAGSLTVEAKIVHATCRMRGRAVKVASNVVAYVDRIRDGYGTQRVVLTTSGEAYRLDEVEPIEESLH